jgi:hypothetical protein
MASSNKPSPAAAEGTAIERRKAEHLRIAAEADIETRQAPGWDDVHLVHDALPATDAARIDLSTRLLGHALALPLGAHKRERAASGVMMLPIAEAGTLREVGGVAAARAVPGVQDVHITIPRGRPVVPLPEGDRYLGFVFARGETPEQVESALRQAHAALDVVLD